MTMLNTVYGIEIPEQSSGSELFFSLLNDNQNKTQMKMNKIIEQRIKNNWRINAQQINEYE